MALQFFVFVLGLISTSYCSDLGDSHCHQKMFALEQKYNDLERKYDDPPGPTGTKGNTRWCFCIFITSLLGVADCLLSI